MLKKTKKGYWILEKFAQQKGLIHGFSTRRFGDMMVQKSLGENKNLDKFLRIFNLDKENLVMMEQVHGNKIKVVGESDKGKVIPAIDGMVTEKPGVILGVRTTDCLPILFYDPIKKLIGIAHAGWQGILKRIASKVVDLMIKKGSTPSEILIGVGPHIGSCCYLVDNQWAKQFVGEFGNLPLMVYADQNGTHLNLAVPTLFQLITTGVLKENIFLPLTCTSCQSQDFFSYRRKRINGRILGIIGLIN